MVRPSLTTAAHGNTYTNLVSMNLRTGSCDKDGVTTDPVHVDARARLQVKHVDVAKLRDYVDHVILAGYLQGIGMGRGNVEWQ